MFKSFIILLTFLFLSNAYAEQVNKLVIEGNKEFLKKQLKFMVK